VTGVKIVFVSQSSWDLALLKLPQDGLLYPHLEVPLGSFSENGFSVGIPVFSLGFGLFSPILGTF